MRVRSLMTLVLRTENASVVPASHAASVDGRATSRAPYPSAARQSSDAGGTTPARAARLQAHLSRWLMLYALGSMLAGALVGYPLRDWTARHTDDLGTLTTVSVFLVIYPMMVNLRVEALARAGRNVRGLALALIYNFVWAPAVGLVLARFFLHDHLLALGFLLVMVVPCSSMSIAYTGLAKGDVELATVVVGTSFVLAIAVVPAWMAVFASGYDVDVPIGSLVVSIVTVLIGPMIGGWLTRVWVVRRRGPAVMGRLQPAFSAASMLAMFATIFGIFFGKATMIVDRWTTVLLLLVPNAVFMALTLAVATWMNRRLGLTYEQSVAVVFASAGKNNATAIAIAATAFSPLVAVPAATMPIFQVILLVGFLRLSPRVRTYYSRRPTAGQVAEAISPEPSPEPAR